MVVSGTRIDSGERAEQWVFGLCAEWCGVCRDWRGAFEAAASRHPQHRFIWVDVEDQADLVGDLDIETFPTLLVGTATQVLFFGTIEPSPVLIDRLLAGSDGSGSATTEPETLALLQRLVSVQL
ncbi:MAG: thioredoxin family protein [Ramlibacter sp.]|nr:thioredoxin family protein [Ramlibacter sp.]